jgi:RNA polymerase sigma factor (sigma-70 family)
MVHDHGRAEDITQEVFMSALRRMRETERPIIFKPWVYEIAKNACIDAFRRSKRAEEVSYDAEEGLGGSDYGRLVSSSPTPDAAVDTRMSLDHLRGAFGGLSETHHDILVMRELEGLSYREIGKRLGMSRPSVESTLFRARRRLTEEYEELTSGERCTRVLSLIADRDGRRMGVRDERKLARHVSYCQPCRRAAYAAGFDLAALEAKKSLGAKIAGLLPFPAFVKRWFGGGGDTAAARFTSAASQCAEPATGWVKAAAIAATVAVAGAGAGVATSQGDSKTPSTPRPAAAGAPVQPAASQKQAGARTSSTTSRRSRTTARSTTVGARRGVKAGRSGAGSGAKSGSGSGKTPTTAGGSSSASGGSRDGSAAGAKTASPTRTGAVDSAAKQTTTAAGKAVNGTTTAVDKTVSGATGAVDKTVSGATGAVDKTVNKTTDTVQGTVGGVTGAVDRATDGATAPASGAVNGATGAASDAVNGAANTATGAVGGAAGTATDAVRGVTGTATGAVNDPVGTTTGAARDPVGTVGGTAGGLLPH